MFLLRLSGIFTKDRFLFLHVFQNCAWISQCFYLCQIKVSEYPFKKNKNMLKNKTVLLYTYFYNISLNVLRPTFFNICNLPFSHFPNIRKIRVKVGPKTNCFSYFMSSCTDRIVVFNSFFFHLCLANQESNKTVPAVFFFSTIFWIIFF